MNKEEFLKTIRKKINYIFDRNSIENELRNHIDERIFDLMDEGYNEVEAERIAVEQMGDPNEIGKMLNKEHHPIIGYCLIISRVCLVCLFIPLMIIMASILWDSFQMLTPITVEKTKEKIEINIELEFPSHDVIIDNICHTNIYSNDYYLTYRSWKNYEYSRITTDGSSLFTIEGKDEKFILEGAGSHHGFFGSYGYIEFEMPEDKIIYIRTKDDEIIKIDLKEYDNE